MRRFQWVAVLVCVFAALCALLPGFAQWVTGWLSAPLGAFLARVSAVVPIAIILCSLFIRPRVVTAAAMALVIFAMVWIPPMAVRVEKIPEAKRERLYALCEYLVDGLNMSVPVAHSPEEALIIAREVMNSPAVPRPARFPYIMRKLGLAGIYIPVTGMAIVDTSRPIEGLIFTAAHELAHMAGIADETQANIAAYEACKAYGGAAEYSADLWALGYAVNRLGDYEVLSRLTDENYAALTGLPCSADDEYACLADYLANDQK